MSVLTHQFKVSINRSLSSDAQDKDQRHNKREHLGKNWLPQQTVLLAKQGRRLIIDSSTILSPFPAFHKGI